MEGKNLSGQLADWSISDLLQIMHVTKKTGSLDIAGDRAGRIHFHEGTIVGADLTGARQNYVADDKDAVADVLYVLSSLETGSFAFKPDPDMEVNHTWEVEEVLTDVERIRELEAEVAESGLIEATAVRLSEKVDGPMTLSPDDWKVVVGLVQPFTFAHLEARYGRGGAVRVLHTLTRLEVAEAVADDEAVWLDEVAVGLNPSQAADSTQAKHVEPAQDEAETEVVVDPEPESEPAAEPAAAELAEEDVVETVPPGVKGVAAHASTTLTDGVYDEIRRLRSKVSDK